MSGQRLIIDFGEIMSNILSIYLSSRDLLNETRLHSNLALNDVIDVYSVLFFYNLRYKIEWVKCRWTSSFGFDCLFKERIASENKEFHRYKELFRFIPTSIHNLVSPAAKP
ncbi:unnamed protein product [Rhizophagus irregularis]|nr:unnamed protein product [Rhizophagus irregularis]